MSLPLAALLALGLQSAAVPVGVSNPRGAERQAIYDAFEDIYGQSPVVGSIREYRRGGTTLAFVALEESGGGWALFEQAGREWRFVAGVSAAGQANCRLLWAQHVAALLRFEIARVEGSGPVGDELFPLQFYGSMRRSWQSTPSERVCAGSPLRPAPDGGN